MTVNYPWIYGEMVHILRMLYSNYRRVAMKFRDVFIVAAVTIFPLSSFGEEVMSSTQATFNKLDTNQDGYLSQDEAKENIELSKAWSDADLNKDGRLEESEFSAFEETMDPAKTEPSKTPMVSPD